MNKILSTNPKTFTGRVNLGRTPPVRCPRTGRYKKLALKWHPDKNKDEADRELVKRNFMKVNKATLNMLVKVDPYIMYGYPNLKSVSFSA